MSGTIDVPGLPGTEQFRAARLQVFNWGTFSGLHNIPIAERGFLFVGKSGTGKSTLLDAFSALLTPPRWVDFNAAAREAERTGRDRSIMSYVRGAWAEQKDGESGDFATRYLRTTSTWSALCLTYKNGGNQIVSLVQLFWVRGTSTANQDVRRYYLIFQRDFDLREIEEFGTNFDIRKLKQRHSDAIAREDFHPYQERFCRLLGIESEAALRLLHKTQSAKNLGDLNAFLRDFMLDKPATFEVAERLVNEFAELNAAHQAVITARQQVEALVPAHGEFQRMQARIEDHNRLTGVEALIPAYRDSRRLELLREHLESLAVRESGLAGEMQRRKETLDLAKEELRELEQQQRDAGGDRIERWRSEKAELEERRKQTMRRFDQLRDACAKLGRPLAETPAAFAELVGAARGEIENWGERKDESRSRQVELTLRKNQAETSFKEAFKEVEALRRQPSNIPADMLTLRRIVADGTGVAEGSLPFVGELTQVLPSEADWQPVIERLLRNFALSLLVEDRHYPSVSRFINDTNLGQRLFYYRTVLPESSMPKAISANSLLRKLEFKESPLQEWLKSEFRLRFDYGCVESLQEFRRSERAITREGQIKHNKTRHEKDDRRGRDGRLQRLLGFDNREKREEFEKFAQELAEQISGLDKQLRTLAEEESRQQERRIHCQTIVNFQWQEIDLAPLVDRISSIDSRLREAIETNIQLRQLSEQVESARKAVDRAEQQWQAACVEHGGVTRRMEEAEGKVARILANPPPAIAVESRNELDERFARSGQVALDSIDSLTTSVLQSVHLSLST